MNNTARAQDQPQKSKQLPPKPTRIKDRRRLKRVLLITLWILIPLISIGLGIAGYYLVISTKKEIPVKEDSIQEEDNNGIEEETNIIETATINFSFYVASDMRKYSGQGKYDTSEYFRGAAEAMADLGESTFLVIPGDLDPVNSVEWTIDTYMGKDYIWYPVVGNHELPGAGSESYNGENMEILRTFDYGEVNAGPTPCEETTYSLDYQNSHFVMLNQYCNATSDIGIDGDVSDTIYNWLVNDLNSTSKKHIFIFGHEPAFPQPDAENARLRHEGDSLDQYPSHRNRFWSLLKEKNVLVYFCGHTHNYSIFFYNNVWQIDVGHARGVGDTGARSTFVKVNIDGDEVEYETYRYDSESKKYVLVKEEKIRK